jgi:hypothetical protein
MQTDRSWTGGFSEVQRMEVSCVGSGSRETKRAEARSWVWGWDLYKWTCDNSSLLG